MALAAPDVVGAVGHAAVTLVRAADQVILAGVAVEADRGDGRAAEHAGAVRAAVAFDVVVACIAVHEVARATGVDVVVLVVALDVVAAAVRARIAEHDGARRGAVRISCRQAV